MRSRIVRKLVKELLACKLRISALAKHNVELQKTISNMLSSDARAKHAWYALINMDVEGEKHDS